MVGWIPKKRSNSIKESIQILCKYYSFKHFSWIHKDGNVFLHHWNFAAEQTYFWVSASVGFSDNIFFLLFLFQFDKISGWPGLILFPLHFIPMKMFLNNQLLNFTSVYKIKIVDSYILKNFLVCSNPWTFGLLQNFLITKIRYPPSSNDRRCYFIVFSFPVLLRRSMIPNLSSDILRYFLCRRFYIF